MKTFLKLFFFLAFAGLCGFTWLHYEYESFLKSSLKLGSSERILEIPAGAGANTVSHILVKEGIIEHEWMMRFLFKQSSLSGKIQPGTVTLTDGMTVQDLPKVIARVDEYARKTVHIPAGINIYEIGDRLQKQRIADSQVFIQLALDPAHAAESGIPASSFEGYLAPGSYTFEAGTTSELVLAEMHDRWTKQWTSLVSAHRGPYEQALRRLSSDHALITLASLVEKEAVQASERPVIAKVFYNRIGKKMKLQSDPTCIYPPKTPGEKPSPDRCRSNTQYSTYVLPGLPPGPITTPSAASLEAVLMPYAGPDASALLYFVAKQDGSWRHYFSKTYAEHQIAVDYFLKGKMTKKPRGTTQPE